MLSDLEQCLQENGLDIPSRSIIPCVKKLCGALYDKDRKVFSGVMQIENAKSSHISEGRGAEGHSITFEDQVAQLLKEHEKDTNILSEIFEKLDINNDEHEEGDKEEIIRNARFLQDQVCEELDNITNKLVKLYQVKLAEITFSQSSSGRPISLQSQGTSRESSILTGAVKGQLKDEFSIMEDGFASLSLDTTKIELKLQDTLFKDLQETMSEKCPLLNDLFVTLLGSGRTAGYLERRVRKDLSFHLKGAVQALACLVAALFYRTQDPHRTQVAGLQVQVLILNILLFPGEIPSAAYCHHY